MKKVILSAAFVFAAMAGYSQANERDIAEVTAQVSTNDQIRQVANQMQLNEGQYIRLRDLMRARQEQIAEVNSMYSNDPAMRQAKAAAINREFESQLAQSVSQKQYTAYLQLQGRTPAEAGAGYQAGGYGGRALETGATISTGGAAATETGTGTTTTDSAATAPANNMMMKEKGNKTKIESGANEFKSKPNEEKAKTEDVKYKSSPNETKLKSNDNSIKAKSEPGKTKIETPSGKMKMEDNKMKMETKNKKVKIKE